VDHVEAPQQQRHAAHQVEKNHCSHRFYFRFESNDQATAKRRRINQFVRKWLPWCGANAAAESPFFDGKAGHRARNVGVERR
jgi:uncharacterized protein YqiB (DUF1249 family)